MLLLCLRFIAYDERGHFLKAWTSYSNVECNGEVLSWLEDE